MLHRSLAIEVLKKHGVHDEERQLNLLHLMSAILVTVMLNSGSEEDLAIVLNVISECVDRVDEIKKPSSQVWQGAGTGSV